MKKKNKNKGSVTHHVKKNIKDILVIVSVLSTLGIVIQKLCNVIYGIQCEQFYNVPSQYFVADIDGTMLCLIIIAAALVAMMRFYDNIRPNDARSIKGAYGSRLSEAAGYGGFLCVVNISCFVNHIGPDLAKYGLLSIFAYVEDYYVTWLVCGVVATSFWIFFGRIFLCHIKKKQLLSKILCLVNIGCVLFNVMVIGYSFFKLVSYSIADKRWYEIATQDANKYLVLSYKDGKYLMAPISENRIEPTIKLCNDEYFITDGAGYKLRYQCLSDAPQMKIKRGL